MARTDIHRPGSETFDPQDYTLVDVYDLEPEWPDDRASTVRALISSGHKFASHQHTGQCGHCGARIRYAALMIHEPTKQMIYVGQQCLDNRFEDLTQGEFQALRKAAQLDREAARTRQAYDALCESFPVVAYASYVNNLVGDYWFKTTDIMSDIHRKARNYGELSTKQVDLLDRLMDQLDKREQENRARVEEPPAPPVPEGKITVEGEVLTTKWVDNQYGGALKMLVKHASGWKVWGTVPSSLFVESRGPDKGTRVQFTATVTRSDDDETFGFYKRPNKAVRLPS